MKFNANIWKQGNSFIVTLPKQAREVFNIGEEIELEARGIVENTVCKCGHIYSIGQKMDHKCVVMQFTGSKDAYAASELIHKILREQHFKDKNDVIQL